LKGNAAMFEVMAVSEAAHALERALVEGEDVQGPRRALISGWEAYIARVESLMGGDLKDRVEMTQRELEELVSAVEARAPHATILRSLLSLRDEPAYLRFKRIEDQLRALASRLGKAEPSVRIDARDVRIPIEPFRPFWSSF